MILLLSSRLPFSLDYAYMASWTEASKVLAQAAEVER